MNGLHVYILYSIILFIFIILITNSVYLLLLYIGSQNKTETTSIGRLKHVLNFFFLLRKFAILFWINFAVKSLRKKWLQNDRIPHSVSGNIRHRRLINRSESINVQAHTKQFSLNLVLNFKIKNVSFNFGFIYFYWNLTFDYRDCKIPVHSGSCHW